MKRFFLTLLLAGLIMNGLSAKTAVVYFSATGTTEKMAKTAAEVLEADIFEIHPVHKYTEADLNWHDKNSLTTIESKDPKARPEIKAVVSSLQQGSETTDSSTAFEISGYDTVILCYPIWWAYAPKIMYTFVESQDWSGKKLITLCTSGGSKIGRSGSDLVKFANGADFKGGKDFTRGNGEKIKKFVEGSLN